MKRRWLWAGAAVLGLAAGLYIGLPYLLVQRLGLGTVRRCGHTRRVNCAGPC